MIELAHAGLHVADADRSLAFYRDLIGLEVVLDLVTTSDHAREMLDQPDAELRAVILRPPGGFGFLELIEHRVGRQAAVDPAPVNPGTAHVAFYVDDLDGLYARLVDAGVAAVSPRPVPVPPSGVFRDGKVAYVMDPDGIRVELMQGDHHPDGRPRASAA